MKETRNTKIIWGICILIGIIVGVTTAVTNTGNIVLPIVILILIVSLLVSIFDAQKTYRKLLFYEKKLETQKKKQWKIHFSDINREKRNNIIELYNEDISLLEDIIELYIQLIVIDRFFLTKKQMKHINEISEKLKKEVREPSSN